MFRKQMSDAGFSVSIFNQSEVQMNRHLQREKSRLAGWIRSLPKPLALMACNDDHGKHVLDACKLAAVGVPEEVAVLGVDNDELVCELSDPPMTSIALNAEQAGYQAAELLDQWMKGQTVKTQQITVTPTHIVTRQSTDVLAVDDPDVANALRFIRQHSFRTPVQVTDVAEAVATSRRVLERKFQNVLHRSILQEIRRVRVNHIIAMLMETDLPISYIARKTGFSGIEHIARYFRRETGTSLRDYRKKHRP
jgi:LacI family transcriptional regulator